MPLKISTIPRGRVPIPQFGVASHGRIETLGHRRRGRLLVGSAIRVVTFVARLVSRRVTMDEREWLAERFEDTGRGCAVMPAPAARVTRSWCAERARSRRVR
jgi:hypothetical protein